MAKKKSKKYNEAMTKIDKAKIYQLKEAVELLKEMPKAKFDESLESAVTLNLGKSQRIRGVLMYPHTFGKPKKIVVIAKGEKAEEAKKAGADFIGDTDIIQKIAKGWTDFDSVVATPDMMKDVSKLGPVLGRKGLMPNPKTGTVTFEIKKAVTEAKQGRAEFKSDKEGVVGVSVGKISMETDQLLENINAFYSSLLKTKPKDAKGEYVINFTVSKTMSPGIRIDFKSLL